MSAIFLLPVCSTYWLRKYTTRVDSHHVWSWYDHSMHCRVIAFLSDDTSRDLVAYRLLIFWPWTVDVHGGLRDQSCRQIGLRLSVLELWVITFPVGYHWKCVRGHCACAESRDPWVGGQKRLHFWNPRPPYAYSLYNFYRATMTIKGRLLSIFTHTKALDCVNFFASSCDLDLWPFNLEHLSYMAGHVTNPTTKFEDPTTIRSWVTSYNVSHWLPWKCVRFHCACAESRYPWVGGQKQ